MKKIFAGSCLLFALLISGCSGRNGKNTSDSATNTNSGTSQIVFKEYQHDFGKVDEGEKLSYTFNFENKGTSDLILISASTTCGCTVPKYDTKPIPPGSGGKIEVVFDTSGRNSMQTKTITVKSNASTPIVLLKITAEVVGDNK